MRTSMRLTRQKGFVGRMRAVEARHEELYDQPKPYWQIAAEIYDKHPSQYAVQRVIEERYGVTISTKTAGSWVNRGIEERKRQIAAQAGAA
jgi:hypothetical protein